MLFRDRREAGSRLAEALAAHKGKEVLVLAIPRGGVVVAGEVARALDAPLDVIVPRKVGAPQNPELAVGAVAPDGTVIWDEQLMRYFSLSPGDLAGEVERQKREIERRMRKYRGEREPPRLQGRTVIVVDDGVATGHTVTAALRSLRRSGAGHVVLAVPVAPADRVSVLRAEADEFVCLAMPEVFYAVGQFYDRFDQVTDHEVLDILCPAGGA